MVEEIEFAGGHWSLESLSIDPIQLGSVAIDLSPTRQLVVMLLVAVLLPLMPWLRSWSSVVSLLTSPSRSTRYSLAR